MLVYVRWEATRAGSDIIINGSATALRAADMRTDYGVVPVEGARERRKISAVRVSLGHALPVAFCAGKSLSYGGRIRAIGTNTSFLRLT